MGAFTRNFKSRNTEVMKTVYHSHILSKLLYLGELWVDNNKETKREILKVHNNFWKKCDEGIPKGLLDPIMTQKRADLSMMYDVIMGKSHLRLGDFTRRSEVGRSSQNCNLRVPESRKVPKHNEFFTRTIKLWNNVPSRFKNMGKPGFLKEVTDRLLKSLL